jgi:hypothetical protein
VLNPLHGGDLFLLVVSSTVIELSYHFGNNKGDGREECRFRLRWNDDLTITIDDTLEATCRTGGSQ